MAVSAPRSKSASNRLEPVDVVTFGAFQFAGHVPVGKIADFYGLPVPHAEKATPVGNFVADRLPANPSVGNSNLGIGFIRLVHGAATGSPASGSSFSSKQRRRRIHCKRPLVRVDDEPHQGQPPPGNAGRPELRAAHGTRSGGETRWSRIR